MDAEELIRRLAAALAIGLLVGTERHWRERQEAAGRRTAGVRTFALTGLLGGVMAVLALALGQPGGALLLGFGLAALLAAQLPFALREADAENKVSATG
ncbi:MAG: MgtC/SapB family protein, partial [Acetobacteraceae bacterium]|nr:MgtC/SapB family protein [Acetobacteraceae bacterium]